MTESSLILLTWSLNDFDCMPFVNGSAIISLVLMFSMMISFALTCSLMAKYLMSMCLLRFPLLLFLARKITIELSQCIFNSLGIELITCRLTMKLFNKIPCDVASNNEINSASMVEVATNDYFALLQDIAPLVIMKMYLDVNLRESTQPTKS